MATTNQRAYDLGGVDTAFEILLQEVEERIDEINERGAEAFRRSAYSEAHDAMDEAQRMTTFRDRVRDLASESRKLFEAKSPVVQRVPASIPRLRRTATDRPPRGVRTPQQTYEKPILESLQQLGGSGAVAEVLDRVFLKVRHLLNQYDLQPVASSGGREPKWRNSAKWARWDLVRGGFLLSTSQTGVWEISEAGRERLRRDEQGS